jgi:hypothetical protein
MSCLWSGSGEGAVACESCGRPVTRHRDDTGIVVVRVSLLDLLEARDFLHDHRRAVRSVRALTDLLEGGIRNDPVAVEGPGSNTVLSLGGKTSSILPHLPESEKREGEALVDRTERGVGGEATKILPAGDVFQLRGEGGQEAERGAGHLVIILERDEVAEPLVALVFRGGFDLEDCDRED